ncbi:unnamed protein product [Medioppia subpectinata]|uniref:Glucosylceramidase n=1 Tax=Medioppia subpectinata TaxID=1979941 RepID=A0A7R9KTJ9_9ACAR|nr:unnamed protein product [Medioppia subpectinata]CAG2108376.1 unnamed protein product [Medioppia subpectinata]
MYANGSDMKAVYFVALSLAVISTQSIGHILSIMFGERGVLVLYGFDGCSPAQVSSVLHRMMITTDSYDKCWHLLFFQFLDAYKSHDIPVWGLTVENEPVEGQQPHYAFNCLNFTGPTERDFVKLNLGPTLAKAGYTPDKLKLMVFDDNANFLADFVKPILTDKEAAKYVSGIAYHWYGNNPMSGFPDPFLTEVHNTYPNVFLLNTEACHLDGAALGRWDHGEKYAYDIIRALNNYVSGWLEWNMALDMSAGPRWTGGGFGGTLNIDPAKGEAYKQPSFYTIGHFSKFVSPDSIRVGHTVDKLVANLSVVTIERPDKQLVLVALNAGDTDIELDIRESGHRLRYKIAAHSVQSYIW